jgi:hypothetical protein
LVSKPSDLADPVVGDRGHFVEKHIARPRGVGWCKRISDVDQCSEVPRDPRIAGGVDDTTAVCPGGDDGADRSLDLDAFPDSSRPEEHVEPGRAEVAERSRPVLERSITDDAKVSVVVFPRPIPRSPPHIQPREVGLEFATAQGHLTQKYTLCAVLRLKSILFVRAPAQKARFLGA